jgi:LiaF transmembrane domain
LPEHDVDDRNSRTPDHYWGWGGLSAGLIIIAIGVFFLFYNFGWRLPFMRYHNWWALFILIGAVGPLAQAGRHYQASRRVDGNVLHSLTSAAAIVTVALIFLFDLSWNRWWPLFIIYGGLWTMFRRTPRRTENRPADPTAPGS